MSALARNQEYTYTVKPWVINRIIREEGEAYGAGNRTDHDRLYKELFRTFLAEFVQLFFPEAYEAIDFTNVTFLEQELFTDVTGGEKRYVDILAEAELKGERTAIIVHVENQAQRQNRFHERMFIYFSRLFEKYRSRILPIAVFSYDTDRDEPDQFIMSFPFKSILQFSFYSVTLHHKPWRSYIRQDNPVAAALLSQMGYDASERVQVKKEFLRMLVRLQLDPARTQLVTGFFETYLTLNAEEETELREEIEQLDEQEMQEIFRIETSWERKGRFEGKIEGKIEVARRMLHNGMSIDEVMSYTDLPREKLRDLQGENRNE